MTTSPGLERGRRERARHKWRKAAPLIGPPKTNCAVVCSYRSAARKVSVRERPFGAINAAEMLPRVRGNPALVLFLAKAKAQTFGLLLAGNKVFS